MLKDIPLLALRNTDNRSVNLYYRIYPEITTLQGRVTLH